MLEKALVRMLPLTIVHHQISLDTITGQLKETIILTQAKKVLRALLRLTNLNNELD